MSVVIGIFKVVIIVSRLWEFLNIRDYDIVLIDVDWNGVNVGLLLDFMLLCEDFNDLIWGW